ncbi:30S ribosomal protein S6 [Melioribacteraceae bacterium 4301-Me]|uniref:30S ribosomal protein S6 n=1 Tax=Pyranulibacter aquaticus TaxID=3163344 RepID=UPI00359AA24C
MNKRHYESVIIINAALEDEQIEQTISRIQELITTNGGEIIDVDKWGRKRLAYPIKKSKTGYYLIIRHLTIPSSITTIERNFRLDENIVRYLTITLDKRALEAIEKQKQISVTAEDEELIPELTKN